ncbi:hypothetical protein [Dongia deserti]|uniref:hypothetical protein n=1 Tax=Dongia deserti TaxID=2268030 RepID=UPI000E64861C|nr:hypothetical protein [Dongia deserti]
MTDRTTITGISGVRPKRHQDVVHIDFSAKQRPLHLALHRGILGALITSLLQAARAFPSDSDEFLSQPLQLTGVGVVSFEDGSFGLELLLDEGLHLFVAIPSESIASLRDSVNVVDALGTAMTEDLSGMTQH